MLASSRAWLEQEGGQDMQMPRESLGSNRTQSAEKTQYVSLPRVSMNPGVV